MSPPFDVDPHLSQFGLPFPLPTGAVPGIVVGSWLAARMPDPLLRPVLALTRAVGTRIVL